MTGAGLPHSDTLGSQLGWQLPEAYRSLPRPSSAPDAKTSTICPYTLTTRQSDATIKMLASTMHFSKNNHTPPETTHPRNPQPPTPGTHPAQETRDHNRPVPSGPNSAPPTA